MGSGKFNAGGGGGPQQWPSISSRGGKGLHATQTKDMCQPDGPPSSYADMVSPAFLHHNAENWVTNTGDS